VTPYVTDRSVQPILVVLVYRGGERFRRAMESIGPAENLFRRIIVSITGPEDSPDMATVNGYLSQRQASATPSKVEVICSGVELPTMEHQRFWIDYAERTGATPDDWIYWLAYDDQVRARGIEALLDEEGNWPLTPGTIYFGPWAMRHEKAETPFDGPWDVPIESWTSFPITGPTRSTVADWICRQMRQPTYLQMSGSLATLRSFQALRDSWPRKRGPMRIEMAMAAAPSNTYVVELPEPIVIIYGRPNSDRANYANTARREDIHLIAWLLQYSLRHPRTLLKFAGAAAGVAASYARVLTGRGSLPAEDWVVRGVVEP
jgi:hypothetical protein